MSMFLQKARRYGFEEVTKAAQNEADCRDEEGQELGNSGVNQGGDLRGQADQGMWLLCISRHSHKAVRFSNARDKEENRNGSRCFRISKQSLEKSINLKENQSQTVHGIVISLMLYNAEVWTPKKQDIKALEAAHFRMLRSMMNVRKEERVKMKEMLQTFELPTIEHYITQKRMRWVGARAPSR